MADRNIDHPQNDRGGRTLANIQDTLREIEGVETTLLPPEEKILKNDIIAIEDAGDVQLFVAIRVDESNGELMYGKMNIDDKREPLFGTPIEKLPAKPLGVLRIKIQSKKQTYIEVLTGVIDEIRQKGDKPTVVKELQERGKAKVIPLLRDEFERQIREQLGL